MIKGAEKTLITLSRTSPAINTQRAGMGARSQSFCSEALCCCSNIGAIGAAVYSAAPEQRRC